MAGRALRHLLLAAMTVAATTPLATASEPVRAPLVVHADDPLRFTRAGAPVYPAGYYPSLGTFSDRTRVEEKYYLDYFDALAANGLTYTRMVFTMGQGAVDASMPFLRTGPGRARDGGPKFDLTRFDESHFDYWRDVLEAARVRGITVQLVILDAWHNRKWQWGRGVNAKWGMRHDFFAAGNNVNGANARTFADWISGAGPVFQAQTGLVGKVVDTLGHFPNIVWEVANEANVAGGGAADRWQRTLADFITRREAAHGHPRHLVMPRDLPNHESLGHVRPKMIRDRAIGQPLIVDNDIGTEIWTPRFRREKAWAALTAGAHINFFHFPMGDPEVLRSADVRRGMEFVGNARRFVEGLQVDLVGMAPCDALVSTGWCLGRPGEEYVIYLPEGGMVTVDGLPESHDATWFDPRTAETRLAGSGPDFAAPDDKDWALHIERAEPRPKARSG